MRFQIEKKIISLPELVHLDSFIADLTESLEEVRVVITDLVFANSAGLQLSLSLTGGSAALLPLPPSPSHELVIVVPDGDAVLADDVVANLQSGEQQHLLTEATSVPGFSGVF